MAAFPSIPLTNDCFVIVASTNGVTRKTAYGFYVGGTGGQFKNVNVITGAGNSVLFTGIPVGTVIRQVICCVRTTNTTSTAGQLIGFGPT